MIRRALASTAVIVCLGMKRAVFLIDEKGIVRYAHIESLSLFRRRAEELLDVIGGLDGDVKP